MKIIYTISLLLIYCNLYSQQISGLVSDKKQNNIPGANIYIKGSYEGCVSDNEGKFYLETKIRGKQILVISFLGYQQKEINIDLDNPSYLKIILKEEYNELNTVTITAGNFNSSSKTKVAVLKPLDVLTTAGSTGNLVSAFQTLPGTSNIGESGKLYIRGGSSRESQIFIDGMRVFNPYTCSSTNSPVRSRFSPLLFKGMNFNTGGYSAEYGQALSGILLLDTEDIPREEFTNINIMSLGLGLGRIKKWKNSSLAFNGSYINMGLYNKIIKPNSEWTKPYRTASSEAIYRCKTKKGLIKIYTGYSDTKFELYSQDINYNDKIKHSSEDKNIYINTNYKGVLKHNILLKTGIAFSINNKKQRNTANYKQEIGIKDKNLHAKFKLSKRLNNNISTSVGAEYFQKEMNINKSSNEYYNFKLRLKQKSNNSAFFVENDIYFSRNTAIRIGIRGEYSSMHRKYSISPRINLTHRINTENNLSFSYGIFTQDAEDKYFAMKENLNIEKSQHYIINYQYRIKGKTLRIDLFHKKYSNLTKYANIKIADSFSSNGSAYANGLEIFFRDDNTIKNLQYWISYSFLNTKRNNKDYPYEVSPNFSSKHNLSVVTKYWLQAIKSLISVSYSFNSGRPYNNPNKEKFMNEISPNYNNLNLSISYLISPQTILFASVSNIAGFDNIYTYKYSTKLNNNNYYDVMPIKPDRKRFIMIGLFMTISKNKNKNQINEL